MKSPLRILYLEDDPRDAELVQEMLASDGIGHVTRVETEADFSASLEQGGFDLILADYTLPSFDGLSALKIAQQDWPHVPLIFVSGTLGEEVAIEALKIGATDYVFKTRLSRIVSSVQRALREAEERIDLSPSNYKAGFRFGRLGYELVEKRGLRRFQARTYVSFGNLVMPWTKHVKTGRDLLRRAFEAANKIGDLTFAAYSRMDLNTNLLAAGDPLVEVQRETEHGLEFAQKMRFGLVIDRITAQLGLIRTLRGLTQKFGSFDDGQFDELRFEGHLAGNPALALPECWYWTRKLQARFFAGDYAAAVDASLRAQRLLWTSPSCFETAEYHFYGALSRAASCDSAAADQRQQHFEALTAHHGQLEVWAENCPENFENRAALVGAEIARIEGRELDAERLYEHAIRSPAPTALSTMRRSPTNWPRDSTRRVVLKRLPMRTCETPGTVISVGEPQGRCANLKSYIHTSGKRQHPLR